MKPNGFGPLGLARAACFVLGLGSLLIGIGMLSIPICLMFLGAILMVPMVMAALREAKP